jgi:hypothetical protein
MEDFVASRFTDQITNWNATFPEGSLDSKVAAIGLGRQNLHPMGSDLSKMRMVTCDISNNLDNGNEDNGHQFKLLDLSPRES